MSWGSATQSLLAALVMLATTSDTAHALSCSVQSPEESFRDTPIVFYGRVVQVIAHPHHSQFVAALRFEPVERIKGIVGAEEFARVGWWSNWPLGPDPARWLDAPPRLVAAARNRDGTLTIGGCIGVGRASFEPIIARFRAALAEADRTVAARPNDIAAAVVRAQVLEYWDDFERADLAYREVVLHWPDDSRGWLGRGRVAFRRESFADAKALLVAAIERDGRSSEARRLLGQALLHLNDPAGLAAIDLQGLRLSRRDLAPPQSGARNFSDARLDNVSFRAWDLSGSRFDRAEMLGVVFAQARLVRVSMRALNAREVNLTDANIDGADLAGAVLTGATFVGTRARHLRAAGANFESGRIDRADFTGSDLRGARFDYATIAAANFAGARLDRASFVRTQLDFVDLSQASLRGAVFDFAEVTCATRFPPGFDPLRARALARDRSCLPAAWRNDFSGFDFRGAQIDLSDRDLTRASFRNAQLDGTPFRRAILRGADFSNSVGAGQFAGADLTNADFTNARRVDGLTGWRVRDYAIDPPRLLGARFRGATISPTTFGGDATGSTAPDLDGARLDGAIMICTEFVAMQPSPLRAHLLARLRALEPRRHGIILGEGCDRVPELADVR